MYFFKANNYYPKIYKLQKYTKRRSVTPFYDAGRQQRLEIVKGTRG